MEETNPKTSAVERTLNALKREYVVVGTTRVRSWTAWLLIGTTAGIAAGIVLVASRSGVESSSALSFGSEITVELDMPNYLPEFLKHPQKFFSLGLKLLTQRVY